jgi:Right handed beta helix region
MQTANRLAAALGAVLVIGAAAPAAATAPATTHTVRPGESIQAALDAARPGDTVYVQRGEYRENLEIVKDGITLRARGAVLRPPEPTQQRRCSMAYQLPTNDFGLCIAGELQPGRRPVVLQPVRDVTVSGLAVKGFAVSGIVVIGGNGTRVENAEMDGGSYYGLLVSQSSGADVVGNLVNGGDSGGIYIGDSPQADSRVVGNKVVGAGMFGIYLRQASHGSVVGNDVSESCVGIGLVASIPDPAAVTDWRVTGNRVRDNNRRCAPESPGAEALTGVGIVIAGGSRNTVSYNLVSHNKVAPGLSPWGGGIVLAGDLFGGPVDPAGNHIVGNVLYDNAPFDLMVLAPGTDTRIVRNLCRTSSPPGLCLGSH